MGLKWLDELSEYCGIPILHEKAKFHYFKRLAKNPLLQSTRSWSHQGRSLIIMDEIDKTYIDFICDDHDQAR
jgi:hypothetical protein